MTRIIRTLSLYELIGHCVGRLSLTHLLPRFLDTASSADDALGQAQVHGRGERSKYHGIARDVAMRRLQPQLWRAFVYGAFY